MSTSATCFWRRLDVPGHDAARVSQAADGFALHGQSVFLDLRGPAALRYALDLSRDWSTREGCIAGFIGDHAIDTHIVRTRNGWTVDGKNFGMPEVNDLDLGFTPATNMVQLRRLNLSVGDAVAFDVAWLDAGDETIVRLPQEYRRVSEFEYDYSSPTTDYQSTLVLAPSGFAAHYPGLWEIER